MSANITVDSGNEKLFLIEGELTEVQTARTTVNLLAQIQSRSQAETLASGVIAAVGDMYGLLSSNTAVGLYDGEDVDNFAGLVGGRVICGTFDMARELASGDTIKAVVSQRGDVLFAHSVTRTRDHLLLLPVNTFAGEQVLYRMSLRTFWGCVLGMWGFAGIGVMVLDGRPRPMSDHVILFLMAFILPLLTMWFVEVPTYRQMKPYGQYASAIFKVYGFRRPDDFDASKGVNSFADGGFLAFSAEKALEVHNAKWGIT